VHHLADLLATDAGGEIPRGPAVRVLDVGVGANAIYPLIGQREYGWSFVGSDVDATALVSAARILAANPGLAESIVLRRQVDRNAIFPGVVQAGERFDLTLCNPPFHGSMREVREASEQKWRKLGRDANSPLRNFGGHGAELWCEGGEAGFIRRMISESLDLCDQVRWFTVLVSRSASLPDVHRTLRQVEARDIRTVAMAQGQKQSRFVAWTFLDAEARRAFGSRP
jgi:23S rRNA (adenine1618-N6)-methyltransferase